MLVTLLFYATFAAGGDAAPAASAGCETPTAASTAADGDAAPAASAGCETPTAASTAAGGDAAAPAASIAAGCEAPAPFDYRGWISMALANVISTTMGFLFWLISSFLTVRLHLFTPCLCPPHPTCRRIKGTCVPL
jgi:hypothetical protein